MEEPTSAGNPAAQDDRRDDVVDFVESARRAELIGEVLAQNLLNFHAARMAVIAERESDVGVTERPQAQPKPRPEQHPAFADRKTRPIRPPVAAPPPVVPMSETSQSAPWEAHPASPPPPSVRPAAAPVIPQRPSRAEIWARFARIRSKRLWGTFTADFAANAFTYVGVLLSIVVIYVFFAFGYFGEAIGDEHKYLRPLVEIGVVVFFLGLAWVLRHRTGIPQTSTAVEMIGIILVPIMLSASFRDGCSPSDRLWCVPADLEGPARWAAYAGAGLLSTGIYYLYARRRQIYAYLLGPMLWVSVGAFALYLEDGIPLLRTSSPFRIDAFASDGISGPQLIAVLGAIGITIAVASRIRDTGPGKLVAGPIMRSAVFATPFVLVLSLVFSYNDAVVRGVVAPDLGDLAWPNFLATAIAAAVFAMASNATFAWEILGPRLRRDMALVLNVAAYLSLAASWLLTAGFGVAPPWLGAGLVGYAIIIALIDRFFPGPRVAAVWIVRTAVMVGASLALLDPGATLAAWGTLGALVVLRSAVPLVERHTARFLPVPELPIDRQVEMWVPVLVATGAGAARLSWPDATPLVLLGAAALFAVARFVPKRWADIRSFAGVPAGVAVAGSLGVELWRQAEGIGMGAYTLSGFLVALAVVVALFDVPAPFRIGALVGLVGAAAMISLREYIGTGAWDTAWIDTAVLAIIGLALVAVALARPQGRDVMFYGTLGHLLVITAGARSLLFEQTAILGLSVVAVAHIAEAVSIEAGRGGVFARAAKRAESGAEFVRSIPTLVALVTLAPIAILIGRQVPLVADERPRFGVLLAALSWVYLAGATQHLARARRIAVPFAYTAALAAVAVSLPSIMASLISAASASAVTALLAVRGNRPYATFVSWGLAVVAALLMAARAGVDNSELHLILHVVAVFLVTGAALTTRARGSRSGLGSAWLHPPVMVGTLLLPAALALALAAGSWVAWVALSTATTYAYLGWSTRAGGVSIPSVGAVAVAYASVLYDHDWVHPFDEPLIWMPLAAGVIGLSALLPGNRRWKVLSDPAPGMVISALAIGTLSLVYSQPAGVLDVALVGQAALLAGVYAVRRHYAWLAVSGVASVAAGLVAGDYWAPATTLAVTLILGFFADQRREGVAGEALRWASIAGLAATFGLLSVWQDWTVGQYIVVPGVAAVVLLPAAGALTVATSWPHRVRCWVLPLYGLGHGLAIASVFAAALGLSRHNAYGVAALMMLLEAGVFGTIGTISRRFDAVVASTMLAAGSYAAFSRWQQWDGVEVITYTAIVGGGLLTASALADVVRSMPERARLWREPVFWLSQLAAAAVIMVAVAELSQARAAGVVAAVVAFEALVVGAVGTIKRDQMRVFASGVLTAASYSLVPGWLAWTRGEFVAVTAIVAVVLALGATIATRVQAEGKSLRLWVVPLHALVVTAAVSIAVKVVGPWPDWQQLWVIAGVIFGLGVHATVNAWATPRQWQIRAVAAGIYLATAMLAVAAEVARGIAVFETVLVVGGLGLVAAFAAGLLANTERRWRLEVAGLSAGLGATSFFGVVATYEPIGIEAGTLLVIIGSSLAVYGLLAHNLATVEAAMVTWLVALMVLVNEQMVLTLHAAVVISSLTLLSTIELERHRRRLAPLPIPSGLLHLEWVLMLAPLTLATADMFGSLWYGLALFAEGVLLAGWGALSEVRRRAILGVGAMFLAIVMSVVIPALQGMNAGLTGGTWLTIGAVAAALFIIAGSTIERQRHAIGRQLAHIADILEDWE